jgi:hypothetical protein
MERRMSMGKIIAGKWQNYGLVRVRRKDYISDIPPGYIRWEKPWYEIQYLARGIGWVSSKRIAQSTWDEKERRKVEAILAKLDI